MRTVVILIVGTATLGVAAYAMGRRRRARQPVAAALPVVRVVALSGPSAAGKSTLVEALQAACAVTVVTCDDYYLSKDDCPRFDLKGLPWPGGAVPPAFAERGNADMNVPDSVDWAGVHAAVCAAKSSVQSGTILVDGLLLFGDHPGARQALGECDHVATLWADGEDARAMEALWRRKHSRSHLGKRSYRERGVAEEAFRVYWDAYVWPAWVAHGASRVPAGALRIDALAPTAEQLDALLRTGWFVRNGSA